MGTFGFSKRVIFRLTEQDYARALAHVNHNPEKYNNLSHLVRSALIQKINEEV